MPYLAIDKDGNELIYERKEPCSELCEYAFIKLPHGTIKKIIGRSLKKREMPIELKSEENG